MTQLVARGVGRLDRGVAPRDAIVAEMQGIVRRAAAPGAVGESTKAAINRAARRLGLSYRRTRTFWYGSHCAVLALEADRMRAVELRLLAERRTRLTAELNQVTARLNALEGPGHAATGTEDGSSVDLAR